LTYLSASDVTADLEVLTVESTDAGCVLQIL
jgi:hypothetical protein